MIALIIILSLIAATAIYTSYNLLRKNEALEDYTVDATKELDEMAEKLETYKSRTKILLQTLKTIDSKQLFEKDDEVGTLFEQIKTMIDAYGEAQKEEEK